MEGDTRTTHPQLDPFGGGTSPCGDEAFQETLRTSPWGNTPPNARLPALRCKAVESSTPVGA